MYEELISVNKNYISNVKSFRNYSSELQMLVHELNINKMATISGLRHTGKTKLISEFIKKTQQQSDTFYFNAELDRIGAVKNEQDLVTLMDVYVRIYKIPKIIVLQNANTIHGIKSFIQKLYKAKKYKIIIVGNNIKIDGVKNITLYPLPLTQKNLENYKYGGIPEVRIIPDISYKAFLLEALKHDIISRDILEAYNIKNISLFYKVLYYLSISHKYESLREIHRNLEHYGVDISLLTLIDYINAALTTHLIHRAYKYDIKTENFISSQAQYFFGDIGIRYSLSGDDFNYLENALYLEFLSRGYEVSGAINGRFAFEIYARKQGNSIAISLSNTAEDKTQVRKRARKLAKIGESTKKYVIVSSKEILNMRKYEEDGVMIVELGEFLTHNIK